MVTEFVEATKYIKIGPSKEGVSAPSLQITAKDDSIGIEQFSVSYTPLSIRAFGTNKLIFNKDSTCIYGTLMFQEADVDDPKTLLSIAKDGPITATGLSIAKDGAITATGSLTVNKTLTVAGSGGKSALVVREDGAITATGLSIAKDGAITATGSLTVNKILTVLGNISVKNNGDVTKSFETVRIDATDAQLHLGGKGKDGDIFVYGSDKIGYPTLQINGHDGKLMLKELAPLASTAVQLTGNLTVTGVIKPSAGTSEATGILFPTDPGGAGDVAWMRYYPRAGENRTLEIGISNDADDHIALMPSGGVGIGTSSPKAKLEVVGGGGGSIDFVVNGRLQSNNNDGGLWITSDRFIGGFGDGRVGFWNGGAWRLTVKRDGSVGIGTPDPEAKLHVDGSIRAKDKFVIKDIRITIHDDGQPGGDLEDNWYRCGEDLNKGAGGKFIYLEYQRAKT